MLQVDSVYKKFGGVIALDNVSYSLDGKEIAGIIGPNGSGKTTLLNVISGLVKPDRGRVLFKGEDITKLPLDAIARRGIARTFQQPKVFQKFSVFENMLIAINDRSKIYDSLKRVGLDNQICRNAGSLTILDVRRLEIARCLALEPEIILLDEPFAGLTTQEAVLLSDLITSLYKDLGISFVIVEHRLKYLFKLAQRVTVMHAGRVIAEGSPGDVISDKKVREVYLGV
jgi:branched-chain amino acid transport system ATP-binding protein